MQQVKILIALLAVVFAFTQAFSPHAKFALTYYSYIAGKNAFNASAWTHTNEPCTCNDPSGIACAIKANPGTGNHPSQADVTTLKNASSGFTASYNSTTLCVRVCHN